MKRASQKATHQQTKTYNSQLVLKTIYDQEQVSRAEVARLTGLTRTTVSELVGELLEQGLVEEVGFGLSQGGKTPILLSVVDGARHLLGVTLTTSAFTGALINLRGEVLHTSSRAAHDLSGEQALTVIYDLLDELTAAASQPLLGIGLGTPGLLDTANGVVYQAVHLGWQNLPLGDLLRARYDVPVYVANDSQLIALAEYIFGEGTGDGNRVVVKVGHGIGAGIVLRGQLFQGDGYGAGEIGHVTVVENGELCRCGNRGCLETVASSSALVRRAQQLAQAEPDSALNRLATAPHLLTREQVLQAYEMGDEGVRALVLEAGRYLGIGLANLVGVLNLHRIVLAGWMTHFGQPWQEAASEEMRRRVLPTLANQTEILLSTLGPNVEVLGASALLLTHELGLNLAR